MEGVERRCLLEELEDSIEGFKVTLLLGPRACGRSSIFRGLGIPEENTFDLEDPMGLVGVENPGEALASVQGAVVLDAFEGELGLLPTLKELLERWGGPTRFLIVARSGLNVERKLAECFGRQLNVVRMGGLDRGDVGQAGWERLWLRGGFPESFLAEDDELSLRWRRSLIQMLVRRDLPGFGISAPAERLHRLLKIAAEFHGQTWNSSAIAAELGVSPPTARAYLEVLSEACVLRQLPPFMGQGTKRTVKAPKVYFRDSGLLHALKGIETLDELRADPIHEASWEGFALEQLVATLSLKPEEMFFWATHGGAEMDLVVERGGKRFGFEFKVTEKPRVTHSMTIAKGDLGLEKLWLVHPGEASFPLRDGMEALGMAGGLDRATLPGLP